eukprot:UN02605
MPALQRQKPVMPGTRLPGYTPPKDEFKPMKNKRNAYYNRNYAVNNTKLEGLKQPARTIKIIETQATGIMVIKKEMLEFIFNLQTIEITITAARTTVAILAYIQAKAEP